jgi:signal transduction histidine kinase/ligand-binding sensor domain-containing protein
MDAPVFLLTRWRTRLLAALFSAALAAAAPADSAWILRTWQSDDGLPNNSVTDLAQTADGYLWIATPAQLARFDGVGFEKFPPKSIVPQFDRKITALLPTAEGGLWLGMNHGPLLYLQGGRAKIVTEETLDLTANALVEDADGAVWIDYRGGSGAVVGGDLMRVKEGKVSHLMQGGGETRSLARDRAGRIWFVRDSRIGRFRGDQFEVQWRAPNRITRLAGASAGGVWLCSGMQLFQLDERGGAQACGELTPERATAQPTVLLEDSRHAVWIGTSDSGLFRFAEGRIERVPTSHPEILCLREDREGNIWVGTGGGGLGRLQPQAIALEGTAQGLPFAEVKSLCENASGTLWAATQNGALARRQHGRWRAEPNQANGFNGTATCVMADATGAVWIGTGERKLYRWQDGRFDSWQRQDGLVSRTTYSLLASKTGDLWIGGNAPESLQRLRAGKLQTITLPPDVRVIRALAEDAAGTIWIGTSKGALLRIEGDRAVDEAAALMGSQLSIRCLHPTPDGSLWIGFAGWGLGRLKNGRFFRVTAEQGLEDEQISQIVADDRGWLWLGADHGIFKVRQQEFDDVAEGRAARLHTIHYGASEGLPSLQANFGVAPVALRSRDGRVWLPMRTALAVADPHQVRQDLAPPVVWLKRVVVDDRTVAFYSGATVLPGTIDLRQPQRALQLTPAHRRLEFEFTALSFAAPENVSFQYRLDGLDERWIEQAATRTVSYSRLPAGEYTFRVKAGNRDGVWNETGAAFAFTVKPFVWQTWWFRLSVITGFTAAVIALARYISFRRLRLKLQVLEQRAALDRERARIAKDIHDDVGASLTQVTLLSGLAQRDRTEPDKVREHVGRIAAAARSVTDSLDEIVWAVNPRHDTLPHLVNYLAKYAREFLQTADLRCGLELPESPPARVLSAEVRHNLFLAVKEALHNAVRHARAAAVTLAITPADAALTIEVRDDGQGFDRAPDDDGADGLRNMRQRLAAIGGECRIESRAGAGTRVTFVLPWPKR